MLINRPDLEGFAYPEKKDATYTLVDEAGEVLFGENLESPIKLENLKEMVPEGGAIQFFGCKLYVAGMRQRLAPSRHDKEVRLSTGANQEFRPMTPEKRAEEMYRLTQASVAKMTALEARLNQSERARRAHGEKLAREAQERREIEEEADVVEDQIETSSPGDEADATGEAHARR